MSACRDCAGNIDPLEVSVGHVPSKQLSKDHRKSSRSASHVSSAELVPFDVELFFGKHAASRLAKHALRTANNDDTFVSAS